MSIRAHLAEHHGVDTHAGAQEDTLHAMHHHDHTFNRPGHKLSENLKAKPLDAAEAQRAKSDRWKPRGRP